MLLRRPAFEELDEAFPTRLDDVRIDELALMAKMPILDEAAVPERGVCRREPRAAQVDVRPSPRPGEEPELGRIEIDVRSAASWS